MQVQGKDCFRTAWTQRPVYNGGNITNVAFDPARLTTVLLGTNAKGVATQTVLTQTAASAGCGTDGVVEGLAMACGDVVNMVDVASGVTLASYSLPMEDVILHLDAVCVGTVAASAPMELTAHDEAAAPRKKSKKAAAKKARKDVASAGLPAAQTAAPPAPAPPALSPELVVPDGVYVALSTRALQLYVLQLVRIAEEHVVAVVAEDEATEREAVARKRPRARSTADQYEYRYELKLVRSWTAAQQAVSHVTFSRGGQYLLSGSTDGGVKGWNVFHHHLTHNLRVPTAGVVTAIALDEREGRLVVGNYEGWVALFDFAQKTLIGHARRHTSAVEAVSFVPESGEIVSVARDRKVAILSPSKQLDELRGIVIKEHVSCAVFETPEVFHVGSLDGIVASYAASVTGPLVLSRRLPRPATVNLEDADEELAIRSIAVSGGAKGMERRRTTATTLLVADAAFNVSHVVQHDAASYVVADALVGYLDQVLQISLLPPRAAPAGHPRGAAGLALGRVVVTNSKDVRVYDSQGCRSSATLRGHTDIVLCCAVTSDGAVIATAGKDRTVRFWCARTWTEIVAGVDGHDGDVSAIAFNCKQSDSYLLLVSVGVDDHIRVWDVGRRVLGRAPAQPARAGNLAEAAVADGDATFTHRSGVNGAHDGPIYAVAVSPNDALVATGGKDRAVNLWNLQGKKLFREAALKGHRRAISTVAFSPADRVLASASNDGAVKVWSLASLTCVKTLQTDKVAVLQAAFFNGGTQLVTGNAEGVLRVWAIAASEVVWSGEAHEEKVWSLVVQERGDRTVFLSGASDGVLVATEDYTAEEADRLRTERHDAVLKEQELANAMRQGQFAVAFQHALSLNHPRHLRQVLVRWSATSPHDCEATLRDTVLPGLGSEDLHRLMEFTRQWVANARHCVIASLVVSCLLGAFHYAALSKMPATQQVLEALLSYLQRHSNRLHDNLRQMYYVDYITKRFMPTTLTTRPFYADTALALQRPPMISSDGPVSDVA